MAEPATHLHYAANGNFDAAGNYTLKAYGFNLADVSSKDLLDGLPSDAKGLVYLGMGNGADAAFQTEVSQYIGDGKVYGFYLFDEPDPTGQWNTKVSATNLKAESDWIHAHVPGAKTFIVMMNMGSPENPSYANTYNPANTGIDLYGIDPYPVRPQFSGGVDYNVIPAAVKAAEANGIPQSAIVPIYQAFGGGGYSSWTMPSAAQAQQELSTWGAAVPTPAFDYVYSWGQQSGDSSLSGSPGLQQVFSAHNAGSVPTPQAIDTLVLHLSADLWNGPPKFIVSVDGKQLAAAQSVTTTHSSGNVQDFAFQGMFGPGNHEITLSFINDAYGGTPAKDRNLYLNSADYDGQHYGSATATLFANGATHFTVATPPSH